MEPKYNPRRSNFKPSKNILPLAQIIESEYDDLTHEEEEDKNTNDYNLKDNNMNLCFSEFSKSGNRKNENLKYISNEKQKIPKKHNNVCETPWQSDDLKLEESCKDIFVHDNFEIQQNNEDEINNIWNKIQQNKTNKIITNQKTIQREVLSNENNCKIFKPLKCKENEKSNSRNSQNILEENIL